MTIEPDTLDALLHPTFDPAAEYEIVARGVAASPGAANGAIVFTATEAVAAAAEGRDVVLVRPFTEADDVAGFHAARGILTSEGGKASHAALVARGMGRPAVTGAADLSIDLGERTVSVNGRVIGEGDHIAINGTTGDVTTDDVPLVDAEMTDEFRTVLGWADAIRSPRRARERRHARGRARRAALRRGGHRAAAHRARLPRRAPADDGGAHPRRHRGAPGRGAAGVRRDCSASTSRACSRRWRACR